MAKGDLVMVAGIAGFLLGGIGVYLAASHEVRIESLENVDRTDEDSLAGLGAKVQELDEAVKALTARVNGLSSDPKALWDEVHALQAKVNELKRAQIGVLGSNAGPELVPPPAAPTPPQNVTPPDTTIGPK